MDYRVEDVDGDGINELLLTDLGGEKPYMLCDVDVTGQLVTQLYSFGNSRFAAKKEAGLSAVLFVLELALILVLIVASRL